MNRYESNLTFFHMAMCVNVLKNCSSRNNPITLAEIQEKLGLISGNQSSRSTTFEKNFKELVYILETNEPYSLEANLRSTFISTFCGIIRRYPSGTYIRTGDILPIKRELYYFEPLLDHNEIELLCGAVTTNPYMSELEKGQLIDRTLAIGSFDERFNSSEISDTNKNVKTTSESYDRYNPQLEEALNRPRICNEKEVEASSGVLRIARQLRDAIISRKKIKITYGRYEFDDTRLNHLKLMPIDKFYILNPYALCWNNGFYYLICTNHDFDNITHFRVDRIMSVEQLKKDRRSIPDEIKPYYQRKGNTCIFDTLRYKNEHPLMSVHAKTNRVSCVFETTTLSVIIDYFGKDIRISETKKSLTDMNGKSHPVYKAEVENVEYSSALLFALQQNQLVKLIKPVSMVKELENSLYSSLNLL